MKKRLTFLLFLILLLSACKKDDFNNANTLRKLYKISLLSGKNLKRGLAN